MAEVHLYDCPSYAADRIQAIVGQAMDALGLRPSGHTLVKPNVVASGKHFPHAYTRPELVEGVLRALKERGQEIEELAIGERCGITVPTRFAFKEADYYRMADRVGGVLMHHFDEVSQVEIPLRHQGRLRDALWTPEPVARADFFVNCPKFKAHPWTTVTFSMKNYIGIQDDRHRLIDHDHALDRKVADLQSIVQPQLVVMDAIIAGEGRMLTPIPFDLGLVIVGDNQVAVDAVCCRLIGLDPREVPHIRLAWERGFGPLDDITIGGDVSFEAARERAEGFQVGLVRVEDYFQGTNIRAYGGRPPSDETDYCWGGCPGALEEAIEVLRLYDAATDEKMPPLHLVFGRYEGEIPAQAGEKVIFIGDCAEYHGHIAGQPVDIDSVYVDRSQKDPLSATAEDIFVKMFKTTGTFLRERNQQVTRMVGCPVSVAEQILALVQVAGLKNPYLEPVQAISFSNAYMSWRARTVLARMLGVPYHNLDFSERGRAAP